MWPTAASHSQARAPPPDCAYIDCAYMVDLCAHDRRAYIHIHMTYAYAYTSLCLCTYYRYDLTIAAVLDLIAEQTDAHGGPVLVVVVVVVVK